MDNVIVIALVVIAALIAIGVWLSMRRRNTDHLRNRFGDEYDRTLDNAGDRRKAEAALAEREKRVAALDIRPLTDEERSRFSGEWDEVRRIFIDSPVEAVLHADRMLATMMKAKGFPMADFDRRFEDLTVNHGDVARHYRAAHEIAERHNSGNASTEEMRQAMKHYEALYDRLFDDGRTPAKSVASATTIQSDGSDNTVARDLDADGDADFVKQDLDGDGDTDRIAVKTD